MADAPSSQSRHAIFEGIRREGEHGHEYWSAREHNKYLAAAAYVMTDTVSAAEAINRRKGHV